MPYESGPYPRRRGKGKQILISILVVLLVVLTGTYFLADSKLRKEVDLGKVIDRPAQGAEGKAAGPRRAADPPGAGGPAGSAWADDQSATSTASPVDSP